MKCMLGKNNGELMDECNKISDRPATFWVQDCLFVERQGAGGHLCRAGIPWAPAPSFGANVIKINSGRPHLMRINAGADESTCPSPTTHAYQSVINCCEWLQVWVCVLCNLWEHLVPAGFVMNKKIEGENWISLHEPGLFIFYLFFFKMALTQYELLMLLRATKTNPLSSFQQN